MGKKKEDDWHIGITIRALRRSQDLTQEELGRLAGTGIIFISQLERGKKTVRLDKLLAVLRILGLELQLARGRRGIALGQDLNKNDLVNK